MGRSLYFSKSTSTQISFYMYHALISKPSVITSFISHTDMSREPREMSTRARTLKNISHQVNTHSYIIIWPLFHEKFKELKLRSFLCKERNSKWWNTDMKEGVEKYPIIKLRGRNYLGWGEFVVNFNAYTSI